MSLTKTATPVLEYSAADLALAARVVEDLANSRGAGQLVALRRGEIRRVARVLARLAVAVAAR